MLLRQLKKNPKSGYLLFPVLLLGTWVNHLVHPYPFPFSQGEESFVLSGIFLNLVQDAPLANTSITLLLLIIDSFLLQRIFREYLLPDTWSMLPSILFLLIAGGFPGFQTLHPVWIAVTFLLLAIYRLFASFDIRKPYSAVFDAGFILSMGSLFYVNLLVLVPAFMSGAYFLSRDARWREMILVFTGALAPWGITFSIYFLMDRLSMLTEAISQNIINPKDAFSGNVSLIIFTAFLGLLTLAGSYTILRHYDEKKVSFRKYFTFFFLLFVSSVLSYFLIPAVSPEIFIIAAVPVTFLLTNYFSSVRYSLFAEVLFLLIIGLVAYLQFS